ncbi:nucleoside hydrolase [Mucilaginibacter sp.]|uniref:nucleoside hydrolase n=1 Tax=Mucilaginibacter sp. TaxID=1882438 RepID=UPI003264F7AE
MRIIIDNDFEGDPDGYFQLVQHLLSPSVEIRGIIGSHLTNGGGFSKANNTAEEACQNAKKVISLMRLPGKYKIVAGAKNGIKNIDEPQQSEGAQLIIEEAMRTDTDLPLYIVCGAGLTNIASAWLLKPEIAERLTLVWIGGPEYDGIITPPDHGPLEYNLGICIPAAQAVFNNSKIPIWQVPRNAYRQCIFSMDEMMADVAPTSEIGTYLTQLVKDEIKLNRFGNKMGEVYILGDSPLVLLTSLQTGFGQDPASSQYVIKQAPNIASDGTYRYNAKGRPIRVYTWLDTRLMFSDMVAKFKLLGKSNK